MGGVGIVLEPNAYIETEQYKDVFGEPHQIHRWIKDKGRGDMAYLNFYQLLNFGTVRNGFLILPVPGALVTMDNLKLKIIELDNYRMSAIVMQDGWKAKLWTAFYPLTRWINDVPNKLIWTCIIWGLAENSPPGEYPTWDNVYLIRKVKQWLKKLS